MGQDQSQKHSNLSSIKLSNASYEREIGLYNKGFGSIQNSKKLEVYKQLSMGTVIRYPVVEDELTNDNN